MPEYDPSLFNHSRQTSLPQVGQQRPPVRNDFDDFFFEQAQPSLSQRRQKKSGRGNRRRGQLIRGAVVVSMVGVLLAASVFTLYGVFSVVSAKIASFGNIQTPVYTSFAGDSSQTAVNPAYKTTTLSAGISTVQESEIDSDALAMASYDEITPDIDPDPAAVVPITPPEKNATSFWHRLKRTPFSVMSMFAKQENEQPSVVLNQRAMMASSYGFSTKPLLAEVTEGPWIDRFGNITQMGSRTLLFNHELVSPTVMGYDHALKQKMMNVFAEYPDEFIPRVYVYDPQTGREVSIDGERDVSAASVIKLPVLYSFFQAVDKEWVTLDTPLLYTELHRTGGAGILQYKEPGFSIPAYDVVKDMIQISDNTCTNMVIDYLGGWQYLNRHFDTLGFEDTRIRNWLPDLRGTNTIAMRDMVTILYNIQNGYGVSNDSRENLLTILTGTHNKRLLPAKLPRDTMIAHKTGDIGTALADSGIVYLPDGRYYYISVQVERPFNDYTARDIIQDVSKVAYDHMLNQPSNTVEDSTSVEQDDLSINTSDDNERVLISRVVVPH